MRKSLSIGFLQHEIVWENTDVNLQIISQIIRRNTEKIDILVLPEMFHCGFTMFPENVAQSMDGEVVAWMRETAVNTGVAIAGSVVVEEDNKFFNRFLFVAPDGQISIYNKRHLFRMAGEHEVYACGNERIVVEYLGWRIMPLVCYDLRFPIWSRNQNSYDLLMYVANWPTPRQLAWDILLKARAIENQCYVLGVNRTGADNCVGYSGGSALIGPKGNVIVDGNDQGGHIFVGHVALNELNDFRRKFPVHLDADTFNVF